MMLSPLKHLGNGALGEYENYTSLCPTFVKLNKDAAKE